MTSSSKPKMATNSPVIDPIQQGLTYVHSILEPGEMITWSESPAWYLMIMALGYRAFMIWVIFKFLPMVDFKIVGLAIGIVLLLAFMEFKDKPRSNVYVLTDRRAISGALQPDGTWQIEAYPLGTLINAIRTPMLNNITLKFKDGKKKTSLRFLFIGNPTPAMQVLNEIKHAKKIGAF